jgi:four helix bundle protein
MGESYRDLRVWQRAMELVFGVYNVTRSFPKDELYGLVSQMRRAAVSVPSNIAEGKGRLTDRDRAHFYSQARGSLLELETQILIAQRLEYVFEARAKSLIETSAELSRKLNALIERIKADGADQAFHRGILGNETKSSI